MLRLLFFLSALIAYAISAPTPSTELQHQSQGISGTSSVLSKLSRQLSFIPAIIAGIKREACTDADQCSFLEQFKWKNAQRWTIAHDYANGVEFNTWWSKYQVYFQTKLKNLRIAVGKNARHGKDFVSGQVQSNKWHGYGCYEVRMRPPNQEGLITTFFSYTGQYDHAPGQPQAHNEVDVEFVYKKWAKRMVLQANYFTNGKGGNEHIIPLNFNPTKKMHNYAFKWSSAGIEWYVDGKKMYTATKDTPKIWSGPHKIMMNLWPVGAPASGWGGNYVWKGSKSAVYKAVRFTRGESCKIVNKF